LRKRNGALLGLPQHRPGGRLAAAGRQRRSVFCAPCLSRDYNSLSGTLRRVSLYSIAEAVWSAIPDLAGADSAWRSPGSPRQGAEGRSLGSRHGCCLVPWQAKGLAEFGRSPLCRAGGAPPGRLCNSPAGVGRCASLHFGGKLSSASRTSCHGQDYRRAPVSTSCPNGSCTRSEFASSIRTEAHPESRSRLLAFSAQCGRIQTATGWHHTCPEPCFGAVSCQGN